MRNLTKHFVLIAMMVPFYGFASECEDAAELSRVIYAKQTRANQLFNSGKISEETYASILHTQALALKNVDLLIEYCSITKR